MSAPNQFTNPTPDCVFAAYMVKGSHNATLIKLHATHKQNPTMCLYHGELTQVWMRHLNKRWRLTVRAIMFYLEHGRSARFAKPTCGQVECTNPLHQKEIGNSNKTGQE
tara:strand:+ start:15156 stop:15482 length:327 start_codon:yes stop_codon:yes gene_type:complete